MKEVVFLINQIRNSGPIRVVLDIIRSADRKKFHFSVISLRADNTVRPAAKMFENLDVEIHRFDFTLWQLELCTRSVAKQVDNFLKKSYPDALIHAHGYHPTIISTRLSVSHISTIHCICGEDFIQSKGIVIGKYMCWRFLKNLRKSDRNVVISSFMGDYYKKHGIRNLQLIHNGVSFHLNASINRNEKKKALNLPMTKKIIIVPGGLHFRKNNRHTIEQLLKCKYKDFSCVFLGIGNQLAELKEMVKDDSRFIFRGFVDNVDDYLNVADLYISSSFSEGLPLAALEAVCIGVPSLLSSIPPHQEISQALDIEGVETFSICDDSLSVALERYQTRSFNRKQISEKAIQIYSATTMGAKYNKYYEDSFK